MPLSEEIQEYCGRLRQNDSSLTEIDLFGHKIGDEGALALAQALPNNTFLKKLDLRFNNITDKGATILAQALKINKTLQWLGLDGNQITNKGATELAEALKINKTLQALWLGCIQITDKGAADLANALKTNTTLQSLPLFSNEIADKGATALLEALQKHNGSVTYLNLNGNRNISNTTITQQIEALTQQNENGTRNPVPRPLTAPIIFRNALEQIRLLVAKTPNGQAVSIVPLLQQAAALYMSDFWQLKYLYTAVNVYYKLGAISAADRTALIQDMLATAKEWCRTPFETALYRITLEHARQQGTINDLQRIWLEEQGRLVQISNAEFICHIRQLIQQNTDRLDRVEDIQQAMCVAMVRLQNHVQQLDRHVHVMSRNVQQLSQQMQTMAVAINQVQDNVERVAASYSSFIASYQYKKRIEAGCDVLAAIMNICSFGAVGNVFKGVVGFTLGSVVDLSDLKHIRSVVESIQTSVMVVEEGGISSGHDDSGSDGLTVLESFEKGLELAKENLADRKLEEAISRKNAMVLLSASVAVFSQAWELKDNVFHQEEQDHDEPSFSTLDTTITLEEEETTTTNLPIADMSGGQVPSSSLLQQEPQQSTAEMTATTTQAATAAPTAFLSMMERVERLESDLGVPANETIGKNIRQRIGICEVYLGSRPAEGTSSVKLLHLEREMGLSA